MAEDAGVTEQTAGSHSNRFQNRAPLSIRYESFRADALTRLSPSAGDHVLVIWLKDELFEDHPLVRVARVVASLRDDTVLTGFSNSLSALMPVKIIGPWGETTLQAMLEDNDAGYSGDSSDENANLSATGQSLSNVFEKVEMYSASATAADALLLLNSAERVNVGRPENTNAPRENIMGRFGTNGIVFDNATCTDDQLCGELVRELHWLLRQQNAHPKREPATHASKTQRKRPVHPAFSGLMRLLATTGPDRQRISASAPCCCPPKAWICVNWRSGAVIHRRKISRKSRTHLRGARANRIARPQKPIFTAPLPWPESQGQGGANGDDGRGPNISQMDLGPWRRLNAVPQLAEQGLLALADRPLGDTKLAGDISLCAFVEIQCFNQPPRALGQ